MTNSRYFFSPFGEFKWLHCMVISNFLILQALQFLLIRCSLEISVKNVIFTHQLFYWWVVKSFSKWYFCIVAWLGEEVKIFLLGFLFLFLRDRQTVRYWEREIEREIERWREEGKERGREGERGRGREQERMNENE